MTVTDEATTEVARAASGLRDLADFIEANPQFVRAITISPRFLLPTDAEHFASLVSDLGGERHKDADSNYFGVYRMFGSIELHVYAPREQVCEAKVVGTETVEVPDPDAPKIIVERDVIEWECKPVLKAAS